MIKYNTGDLIILRGRALSLDDNAYAIGVIINSKQKRKVKEYDDLWCTKELVWENVYKVFAQGRIINISYYDIKSKAN